MEYSDPYDSLTAFPLMVLGDADLHKGHHMQRNVITSKFQLLKFSSYMVYAYQMPSFLDGPYYGQYTLIEQSPLCLNSTVTDKIL